MNRIDQNELGRRRQRREARRGKGPFTSLSRNGCAQIKQFPRTGDCKDKVSATWRLVEAP